LVQTAAARLIEIGFFFYLGIQSVPGTSHGLHQNLTSNSLEANVRKTFSGTFHSAPLLLFLDISAGELDGRVVDKTKECPRARNSAQEWTTLKFHVN
jgi:hypothetical protein